MPRGDARKADKEYLETFSTTFLRGLRRRVSRSIDELQVYHERIQDILSERSDPGHPLYDKLDEGLNPAKGAQTFGYLQ